MGKLKNPISVLEQRIFLRLCTLLKYSGDLMHVLDNAGDY